MTWLLLWLSGVFFVLGLLIGKFDDEGDGYLVVIAALVWPLIVPPSLYFRLKNWIFDLEFRRQNPEWFA